MKLAKDFRASARDALAGKWMIAVIAALIASLLGGLPSGGSVGFSFSGDFGSIFEEDDTLADGYHGDIASEPEDIFEAFEDMFEGIDMAIFAAVFGVVFIIALVISAVFFVLGSIVGVGYAKFNLDLIDRKEENSINVLFEYFKHWKTTVVANLLRELYIFLWSLLCFIPGIIAGYTYSLVPYIMAENPELSATEACNRSKELMNGNRWRLFCLEISFFGWSLLAALTCGIGYYLLNPYTQAARADFYREISGTRPIPVIAEDLPIYTPAE